MSDLGKRQIIFEMIVVGDYVRVATVDVKTGLEVVAVGPKSASEYELKKLGERKLMRVLEQHLDPNHKKKPGTRPGFTI